MGVQTDQTAHDEASTTPTGCPVSGPSAAADVDLARALDTPFPWPRGRFDPPAEYGALREKCPVARAKLADGRPVWLVTRYDDVRAVLTDPRVSADETDPGFPGMGPRAGTYSKMDDPRHAELRGLVARNFGIKHVASMRPAVQAMVDQAIDEMLATEGRQVDLVPALALRIPANVLGNLLGVPVEDRDHFAEQIQSMLDNGNPLDTEAQERSRRIAEEVYAYVGELIDRELARETPSDDIIGQLAAAHRRGDISHKDAVSSGFLIIGAGFDTTANAAALGVLLLLTHPDQLAKLKADPSLLDVAIEEVLRWLSHVHLIIARVATDDIEIAGVTIPRGEGIMPLNASANRDESHYPQAATFDIERRARDHLAFGFGVHQCQGQSLARMELSVIFETLFRRIPELRLAVDVDEIELKTSARIHGVRALPVAW
ncbi:cytochrome P450 [Nocardioides humi]|uniref:Cytochrome P450 n=1 Tax=Nocardioides humi TaxID=449461 RepID=A0ABN2ABK2_9ACTN|nr:cytochrome P450 [Nocardioides humi]